MIGKTVRTSKKLTDSIRRTIIVFTLVQCAAIFICGGIFSQRLEISIVFAAATVLLHIALYFFMTFDERNFFNESSGVQMTRINLANVITLSRISALPLITFLLLMINKDSVKAVIAALMVLLFLTDSLDGRIARQKKEITRMGRMLDSTSDYFLLAVISVIYYKRDILPLWFFVLLFIRLGFQAVGMFAFMLLKKPIEPNSTPGGKLAITAVMALYVIKLPAVYLSGVWDVISKAAEIAAGVIVFLSCFEKAFIFFKQAQEKRRETREKAITDTT